MNAGFASPVLASAKAPRNWTFRFQVVFVAIAAASIGLFIFGAFYKPSPGVWIFVVLLSVLPFFVMVTYSLSVLNKVRGAIHLFDDRVETRIKMRGNPSIPLSELSAFGLVLANREMGFTKAPEWWLSYGDADGSIRFIYPMFSGDGGLSKYGYANKVDMLWSGGRDLLSETPLGQFATKVYEQALRVQGPNGRLACDDQMERVAHAPDRSRFQTQSGVKAYWCPKHGYKKLEQFGRESEFI